MEGVDPGLRAEPSRERPTGPSSPRVGRRVPAPHTPLLTSSRARRKARGSFSARKVPADASLGRARQEREGEREAGWASPEPRVPNQPPGRPAPSYLTHGVHGLLCSVYSFPGSLPGEVPGRRGLVLRAKGPLGEGRGRAAGGQGPGRARCGRWLCAPRSALGEARARSRAAEGWEGRAGGAAAGRGKAAARGAAIGQLRAQGAGEEVGEAEPQIWVPAPPRALRLRGNFALLVEEVRLAPSTRSFLPEEGGSKRRERHSRFPWRVL